MRRDNCYAVNAKWARREQTVSNLAARLIAFSEALKKLHPSLQSWWFCEHDDVVKPVPSDPEALIARLMPRRDADRSRGEGSSYTCEFRNMPGDHTTQAATSVHSLCSIYSGDGTISFAPDLLGEPDPALYEYDIMRGVLRAMIETFDVDKGIAWPLPLSDIWIEDRGLSDFNLKPAWITYVGPRLAPLLTPVPDAIKEEMPGGGVLLSATRDRFDVKNLDHVAVSRAIAASGVSFRYVRDCPLSA